MFFPISNSHISPVYLAVIGFVIGILGGFFGVGEMPNKTQQPGAKGPTLLPASDKRMP